MRLRKLALENIKSFKDKTEINFSEDINIFIGPNGGGKSNLMNTLSWVLNSRFYSPYVFQPQGNRTVLQVHNFGENAPEPHWSARDKPSFIWIEFVATEEDIEGLREIYRNKESYKIKINEILSWEINQHINKDEIITDYEKGVVDPDEYDMKPGDKFRYKISILRDRRIDALAVSVDEDDKEIEDNRKIIHDAYLRYLSGAEFRKTLKGDINDVNLPYILYSPNRTPHDLSVNLSGGYNFYNLAQSYRAELSNTISSGGGSSQILSQIAATTIGAHFHKLIYEHGLKHAEREFDKSADLQELRAQLESFGFRWTLVPINPWANQFQISIANNNEDEYFSIMQASSGERQLLNFVFGLSSRSTHNSLVIIDEPELNLHPRWQKLLLRFFVNIQKKHKSQFIFSTHSSSFLDENTLPHVRRIYRRNRSSALSSPQNTPEAKDTMVQAVKLLNAQQNERIFFTQKAVLVEGQSDYVIWQKLINITLEIFGIGETIEVIEVLGSANFQKYRTFLNMFDIENYIVADQDYVALIGDSSVKRIFKNLFDESRACNSLLKKHSLDKLKLISAIELAIEENDIHALSNILDYIKCRNTKIRLENFSPEDIKIINDFRAEKSKDDIFILQKGSLEAYYILDNEEAGTLKNDTDKAIAFAADDRAFGTWISNGARLIKGESPTTRDKIMAEEAAEFITIAMKIVGVEITAENGRRILEATKEMARK